MSVLVMPDALPVLPASLIYGEPLPDAAELARQREGAWEAARPERERRYRRFVAGGGSRHDYRTWCEMNARFNDEIPPDRRAEILTEVTESLARFRAESRTRLDRRRQEDERSRAVMADLHQLTGVPVPFASWLPSWLAAA